MSKCSNCGTDFRFSDMLKAMNPSSVKCGGCSERIKSSYMVLALVLVIFFILIAAIFAIPFTDRVNSVHLRVIALVVLGFIFEYGYFFILDKKIINSNLVE